MSADSDSLPVIENDDFIGVFYGIRALGNDNAGDVVHLAERFSELRVRGIVERGGAVIEDDDFRASRNRSCNRKALLLTAGEILSALKNFRVKTAVKIVGKLLRLRDFKRTVNLLVGDIVPAERHIVSQTSRQKLGFLRNNRDFFS